MVDKAMPIPVEKIGPAFGSVSRQIMREIDRRIVTFFWNWFHIHEKRHDMAAECMIKNLNKLISYEISKILLISI